MFFEWIEERGLKDRLIDVLGDSKVLDQFLELME